MVEDILIDPDTRRATIVELVEQRGYVPVEELATRFAVSAQTVRRDIRTLAARQQVTRYHGGAGLPAGADRLAYAARKRRFAAEKRAIARRIAAEIPDGASVFIDIGTTMEAVAEALRARRGLRVITNHFAVASILSEKEDFEVLLPGGVLRNRDRAITGEPAIEFVRGFRVGFGIFGIGSIDRDGILLDYDYRDVQLSATAMAISRRRFVALDHSKFNGGEAIVRVGHVRDIDAVFTDAAPPPDVARMLAIQEVRIVTANGAEDAAGKPAEPAPAPVSYFR